VRLLLGLLPVSAHAVDAVATGAMPDAMLPPPTPITTGQSLYLDVSLNHASRGLFPFIDLHGRLQALPRVLRQLGFDCTAVRSAQAALQQLHEYHQAGMPFELLVSDIEMPELDGYSLVQEIRRSPDIAGTYVLLHTSLDSTMNTEKARSVGANAVLTKFSSVDLTQALLDAFRQMSGQA